MCDVRVELSSDGRKGIQQYEALQNDPMCDLMLVVIDYNMPECNGVTSAVHAALDGKPRRATLARTLEPRVTLVSGWRS